MFGSINQINSTQFHDYSPELFSPVSNISARSWERVFFKVVLDCTLNEIWNFLTSVFLVSRGIWATNCEMYSGFLHIYDISLFTTCCSTPILYRFAGKALHFFFFPQYYPLCLSLPTTWHSPAFTKKAGRVHPQNEPPCYPEDRWNSVLSQMVCDVYLTWISNHDK